MCKYGVSFKEREITIQGIWLLVTKYKVQVFKLIKNCRNHQKSGFFLDYSLVLYLGLKIVICYKLGTIIYQKNRVKMEKKTME